MLALAIVHQVIGLTIGIIVAAVLVNDVVNGGQSPAPLPEFYYEIWGEGATGVVTQFGALAHLLVLAVTITPLLAVTLWRLHNAGMPGLLFFLWFIPLVGWIIVLMLLAAPSKAEKRELQWDRRHHAT